MKAVLCDMLEGRGAVSFKWYAYGAPPALAMTHHAAYDSLRTHHHPSLALYRKRLDASEPLATLFVRLLGSFQTEAEAKNRVLHLYHYVLGEKVGTHDVLRPLL